jgi:hypothetical protein
VENSDKLRTRLLAYKMNGEVQSYLLGPHAPTLSRDDLDLIHRLWLETVPEVGIEMHHRDIVRVALEDLKRQLRSRGRGDVLARLRRQAGKAEPDDTRHAPAPPGSGPVPDASGSPAPGDSSSC